MSARDLAIDLGTANTLVFQPGRGIVFDEPSLVAVEIRTGDVLAVGRQAADLVASGAGNVTTVRPLRRGVITDFAVTERMIRMILHRIGVGRFPRPRALVCVPSAITNVERRAVEEAVADAGARSVTLVEEPLAAAIGAGLPIQEPIGNLVVDVGGGTTEVGVVAMGGLVAGTSIQVGGFDLDAAIQRHLRRAYGVGVGDATAERIKIEVGSAYPAADVRRAIVRGREVSNGVPKEIEVTPEEIREALADRVQAIVETTKNCLAESPPELAHDVLERGIFLTGGGGMLKGLEMRLSQECEVPVHLTEQPLRTVALGAGRLLEYLPDYRSAFVAARRWA
ncbi:MAG TPA: rod shape-determining protein [Actinomycetota bacterium]